MSANNANHENHEAQPQLDQHIAALRDAPTEPGPSESTVAATLLMLRSTQPRPTAMATKRFKPGADGGRPRFIERLVAMTFTQRIAAAVMITVGGLTLYLMFSLFSTMGTSVAFADVARKL